MTKDETKRFMLKIKSFYQEFVIDEFKIKDWHEELKHYDYDDVEKKLDAYMKNEYNDGKIPSLYYLTRYLIRTENKGKQQHYIINCQNCGANVWDYEYNKHTSRCTSINTIMRDMKKYFNLSISFEELSKYDDNKFEEVYLRYCEKMLQSSNVEEFRKKIILRILYPDTNLNITELLQSITKGLKGE